MKEKSLRKPYSKCQSMSFKLQSEVHFAKCSSFLSGSLPKWILLKFNIQGTLRKMQLNKAQHSFCNFFKLISKKEPVGSKANIQETGK